MKKIFFIAFLCFQINIAHALVGPVPYVTSIETGTQSGSQHYYVSASWKVITGIADLDTPIGLDGYVQPIVCGTFARVYASLCMSLSSDDRREVTADMTWREVSNAFTQGRVSGTTRQSGQGSYYSSDMCVGFGISDTKNYIRTQPTWFPGTTCTLAPPPNFTCSQTLSSNTLDLGTKTLSEVDTTKGDVTLTTTCNAKGSITITPITMNGVLNMRKVTGESGIQLKLYFDNALLGDSKTYESTDGTVKHKIGVSLLKDSKDITSGKYSVDVVFLFNYS